MACARKRAKFGLAGTDFGKIRSNCAKPIRSAATFTRFRTISTFIKVQLAQLPKRNEVWRAAKLRLSGGAVAAVTLIETFARACL